MTRAVRVAPAPLGGVAANHSNNNPTANNPTAAAPKLRFRARVAPASLLQLTDNGKYVLLDTAIENILREKITEKIKETYAAEKIEDQDIKFTSCNNLAAKEAGISEIHKVFTFEIKGKEMVFHAKTTAPSKRLCDSRLNEGLLYKTLEELGLGPKAHSTIIYPKDLGSTGIIIASRIIFTITKDVTLEKLSSSKNPDGKIFTFETPNQIKDKGFGKLTQDEIKLLAKGNKAFACVNFVEDNQPPFKDREKLVEYLKSLDHFADDKKSLTKCAFADAVKYILLLGDLTYNTGNSGALTRSVNNQQEKFRIKPVFIDYDLNYDDKKRTPAMSISIENKVKTMFKPAMPGKKSHDPLQFLPGMTFQTGEHNLEIMKEVLRQLKEGTTEKDGTVKTKPFLTAIQDAKESMEALNKGKHASVNKYVEFVERRFNQFTSELEKKVLEAERPSTFVKLTSCFRLSSLSPEQTTR